MRALAAGVHRGGTWCGQDLRDAAGRPRARAEGVDVVIGYCRDVRAEPTRWPRSGTSKWYRAGTVAYRGVTLEELDVEAVISRRPQMCVVDELAHTNAPGSPAGKRYEDVVELWTPASVC